ncbi:class I SAM-dependent methyltransferase [Oceanobacillus profundus]|uniref:Class I SAM-dependent methyltransferase n=1 Tax=Oceanobacillus profundus TaxID=372463 RepID=A0A417YMF3_9BACI|nr:class I SAM-dependent methyltransferase [Oceanobacillus profundus]MBR3121026.1 class I SAM-dependent methyltransferase [Oceanobacillus sp.]MCM3400186.1 class I SAM-dependent methyltransferase [Oceanobacillus profundus]MDO6449080.1 class I SAM-dependent methyltransferase [Oceanobacillus profundus]RHW34581.1 class I SAM-dependent methyltransferase [Oceanobacillus profundus]
MERKSLIKKFDKQANKYNKRRKNDSAYRFRERIFQDVEGKVLEVGIGSGLNFPFYNKDVELTGVDFSGEMMKVAQLAAKEFPFKATFIKEDVESVKFNESIFDTIVSSTTLCAYQNPVIVLNNFQKWCKPGGKILMMEHGISTNKPLSWLQKSLDPLALKFVGCHQDRNISEIVKKSSLQLIKEERYMAGCLYLIWAKP